MESKKSYGYIYLIREREFLNKNENVYKHGKTCLSDATLILPRLKDYKKGSELVFVMQVAIEQVCTIENSITKRFKNVFKKHNDGNEYFIGDPKIMIKEIFEIIQSIESRKDQTDKDVQKEDVCDDTDQDTDTEDETEEETEDDNDETAIQIKTYEDFLKCSSIQKIIITKRPSHGYLILNNLMHDIVEDSDGSATENLQLWLQNNCRDHDVIDGKVTDYEHDFFAIIDTINKNCFQSKFKPQKLLYHQIWFRDNENVTRVFDIKTFNQFECKDYALRNDPHFINLHKFIFNNIDMDLTIIDTLMKAYVKNNDFLFKFKRLCKSVFIQESHEQIILYDTSGPYQPWRILGSCFTGCC